MPATNTDDNSTLTTENCPNVPITNIVVVVIAGPSASATPITVAGLRQSERGSNASAQGTPTPRNIQRSAGSSKKVGSSQSGRLISRRKCSVKAMMCPVLDKTCNHAYYRLDIDICLHV